MEIQETTKGAVKVLRPRGPLCAGDAEQLGAKAREAAASSLNRIVVDASGIPYCDSRGLEILVELAEHLGTSGQTLKLCAATETLREVLDLTDLASHFEHYEDATAAVRSFL